MYSPAFQKDIADARIEDLRRARGTSIHPHGSRHPRPQRVGDCSVARASGAWYSPTHRVQTEAPVMTPVVIETGKPHARSSERPIPHAHSRAYGQATLSPQPHQPGWASDQLSAIRREVAAETEDQS
jgi:hypothetical protein